MSCYSFSWNYNQCMEHIYNYLFSFIQVNFSAMPRTPRVKCCICKSNINGKSYKISWNSVWSQFEAFATEKKVIYNKDIDVICPSCHVKVQDESIRRAKVEKRENAVPVVVPVSPKRCLLYTSPSPR